MSLEVQRLEKKATPLHFTDEYLAPHEYLYQFHGAAVRDVVIQPGAEIFLPPERVGSRD